MTQNKAGFTLIETLFALTVVAMILPALYLLQGSVLRGVSDSGQEYTRLLCAKMFLHELHAQDAAREVSAQQQEKGKSKEKAKEEKKVETKKIDTPPTQLLYEQVPIGAKSSLVSVKGIATERVTLSWKGANGKDLSEKIVSFVYAPREDEA